MMRTTEGSTTPVGIRNAAVAFDYGNVLSFAPAPEHRARLRALTRLSTTEFEQHYTQDRLAYDRGTVTGQENWSAILSHTSVSPTPEVIADLIRTDAMSWSHVDGRMQRSFQISPMTCSQNCGGKDLG